MNYAIILAGGKGVRFEGNIPKQFVESMGEPLLVHSMETAQGSDNVNAICVVSPKECYGRVKTWTNKYHITKLLLVVETGRGRYQPMHSGLKSFPARADDTVIIMTVVYPFVSQLTVDRLYKAMETENACITVAKTTDAITFNNSGENVLRTLQKKELFIQQGPQLFRYGILEQAYKAYLPDRSRTEVNEDSEFVLNIGVGCDMAMGGRFRIKVTYPEDLAIVGTLYPLFIKQEVKIGERM